MKTITEPPQAWRDGSKLEQAAYQGWNDAKRGRGYDPLPGWRATFGAKGATIADNYFQAAKGLSTPAFTLANL